MEITNNPLIKTVLFVLASALVVGSATYYLVSSKAKTDKAALQTNYDTLNKKVADLEKAAATSSTPTTTPPASSDTTTTDPLASWKTYTNTRFAYSIKYPNTWYIKSTDSEKDFTPRGPAPQDYIGGDTYWSNYAKFDYTLENIPVDYNSFSLLIYKTGLEEPFREFYNQKWGQDLTSTITNYKDTTIAGKPAKTFDLRSEDSPSTDVTHFVLLDIAGDRTMNRYMAISYSFNSKSKAKNETTTFNSMVSSLVLK